MSANTRHKAAASKKSGDRPEKDGAIAIKPGVGPPGGSQRNPASEAAVRSRSGGDQAELYERAVSEFHGGRYAAAIRLFEAAEQGSSQEIAHSARLHANMCARRLAKPQLSLRTADEHYDYAVALINERRLEQAERHLLQALAQSPKGDHLFYALALCRGLAGDIEGAYTHLWRAIELHPKNRSAARNDPDFASIAAVSPIAELLYPERAITS